VNGGTLAVMNNLHVPVGLLLNLLIWNQHEAGAVVARRRVILAAVWMSRLGIRRAPHNCVGAAAGAIC
jgi:hypothetical protein